LPSDLCPGKRIVVVVARADNGVIGVGGDLPWRLPPDLAHFKRTTMGHVVVMGRKTFDSMGRPLPGRTNVVVTRQPDWSADGVLTAGSLDDALALASSYDGDVMVIGGGEVYAEALPLADEVVLTEVHLFPAGDVHFPNLEPATWHEVAREFQEHEDVRFDFVRFERV
jgi:dihydrofolate reductase